MAASFTHDQAFTSAMNPVVQDYDGHGGFEEGVPAKLLPGAGSLLDQVRLGLQSS